MYSLVLMVAMTAGPDVPQNHMCPVTPSNYGCGFWLKNNFYDCCAPARYGWVTCWNKGFGFYPGNGRGFYGDCGCCPSYGYFYQPNPCACSCAPCGYGGGHGGGCDWCGCGWSIGDQPAYYTSVLGCPPFLSAPPYACCTDRAPCCNTMSLAFDTGLAGHSHGVGYAGMGGYGNFGFYGAVPMMHRPSTYDLPPMPRYDYLQPVVPGTPAPMPPLPKGSIPEMRPPEVPSSPAIPLPDDAKKPMPKKEEPKKDKVQRPTPATVVLSVPDGATITVEGQPLTSTGRERKFRTPALMPDQEFTYTVRAVVLVAGRAEAETLEVKVIAGEITRASFEKLFAKVGANSPSVVDAKPRR